MTCRSRNGYVDNGSQLKSARKNCPNCGSGRFTTTISREHCPACGLECDYWGCGANSVYEAMIERDHAREQDCRDEERRREEQAERDFWDSQEE